MPSEHARLSASAAERWIHCPGSIKLTEDLKYWTNTQNSEIYIWTFSKGNGISSINFDQDQRARAFVAFKLNY